MQFFRDIRHGIEDSSLRVSKGEIACQRMNFEGELGKSWECGGCIADYAT